eukprot:m.79119 g.79119  ORF g.79119 m.79119 type:complete len:84 (+) comp12559_c1_seq1:197-448(+)
MAPAAPEAYIDQWIQDTTTYFNLLRRTSFFSHDLPPHSAVEAAATDPGSHLHQRLDELAEVQCRWEGGVERAFLVYCVALCRA